MQTDSDQKSEVSGQSASEMTKEQKRQKLAAMMPIMLTCDDEILEITHIQTHTTVRIPVEHMNALAEALQHFPPPAPGSNVVKLRDVSIGTGKSTTIS